MPKNNPYIRKYWRLQKQKSREKRREKDQLGNAKTQHQQTDFIV